MKSLRSLSTPKDPPTVPSTLKVPYDDRQTCWPIVSSSSSERSPVSWKTLPQPQETSKVKPTASSEPVRSLRRKVNFGPRCSSEKPPFLLNSPFVGGSIQVQPSLLITND